MQSNIRLVFHPVARKPTNLKPASTHGITSSQFGGDARFSVSRQVCLQVRCSHPSLID